MATELREELLLFRSQSFILRVGTSHSILGMRPDDWYAHISTLWQKDWQKTLGVGRGGRLTLLGGKSRLLLRLPFCGNNTETEIDLCKQSQTMILQTIKHPESRLYVIHPLDFCEYFILKARVSITATQESFLFLCEPCRKQFRQRLSSWLILWTTRWELDQFQWDWTVLLPRDTEVIEWVDQPPTQRPITLCTLHHQTHLMCQYDGEHTSAKLYTLQIYPEFIIIGFGSLLKLPVTSACVGLGGNLVHKGWTKGGSACFMPVISYPSGFNEKQWMHVSKGAAMTAFFCRPNQTHVNLELKTQSCCSDRSSCLINQVRRCGIRLKASFTQTPEGARAEHTVGVMREKNENF